MKKRCLICEKEIKVDDTTIYDATVWTSHGNFGSTVYDTIHGGEYLEAFICDACLAKKKGLVEEVVVRQRTEVVQRRAPEF